VLGAFDIFGRGMRRLFIRINDHLNFDQRVGAILKYLDVLPAEADREQGAIVVEVMVDVSGIVHGAFRQFPF
jgi:hypothetical protein